MSAPVTVSRVKKLIRAGQDALHQAAERRRNDAQAALARMEAEGTSQSSRAAWVRLSLAVADLIDALARR